MANEGADAAKLKIEADKKFNAVLAKYRRTVGAISEPTELRAIAEEASNIVRKRTRLGYGAEGLGGDRFKLASLSEGYIHFRKTIGSQYLSEATTPTKSNLTFTGQMLDSIAVIKIARGAVTIGPTGKRTDHYSAGVSNAQVARWVSEQGRPFMGFTTPEFSQLVRFYRTRFGDLARRNSAQTS